MKLRLLVFLTSVSVTIALTAALIALFHKVILASYAELEQNRLRSDTHRMVKTLEAEIQSLDRTLQDYATWDVTYKLIRHPDPKFAKSELSKTTMKRLGLRTALICDLRYKVIFSQTYRSGSSSPETATDMKILLRITERLVRGTDQGISGLVTLSDGPVLVAARPVLTTEALGPARGAMVMVRDFDYRLLARLSTVLEAPMLLKDLQRDNSDRDLAAQVNANQGFAFRPLDDNRALGYTVIEALDGKPRYLMSIEHDRSIWNAGKRAEKTLAFTILIFGFTFCLFNLACATVNVIRPVEKFTCFIRSIENSKDLQPRLHIRHPKEFSILAKHINGMLDELQNSHQQLVSARERLQYEATHDALTGAWNHAAALELLDRELARCSREETNVAVILLDADYFKSINDRFGHQTGDAVLQNITAVMGKNLRSSDVLARYGGEEFLIIAPNCTITEAEGLATRVLTNLEKSVIQVGEHKIQVTVTAGVAAAGASFSSEDLISVADRAMYRAKEKGRNRVEVEELTHETLVRGNLYAMPRRLV
jgi:diguanylate cyclase (GGDEF)-like protein